MTKNGVNGNWIMGGVLTKAPSERALLGGCSETTFLRLWSDPGKELTVGWWAASHGTTAGIPMDLKRQEWLAWKVGWWPMMETMCAKPGIPTQPFSCPVQHLPS